MTTEEALELPTGHDLKERWATLSRPAQGELWRKMGRGETSTDRHEAILIAAMAQERRRAWTMRYEIVLPAFVALFGLLSLVWDDFSFTSALTVPVVYAIYMTWMRAGYNRAYERSVEMLTRDVSQDG